MEQSSGVQGDSQEQEKQGIGPRVAELQSRVLRDIKEAQAAAQKRASEASTQTKGIVGGIVAALLAGIGIGVFFMRRRRPRQPWWRDPEQLRDFENWREMWSEWLERMPTREELSKRAGQYWESTEDWRKRAAKAAERSWREMEPWRKRTAAFAGRYVRR